MFERTSRKSSGKPNMTYVELIKRAIQKSPAQALSVSEIYASIEGSHPFFRTSTKGWKNTIRHLLSLTPCFVNNARSAPLSGKGGLWTIDPEASDTACRKRMRSSPSDRPLTTAPFTDRPLLSVRFNRVSPLSSHKPHQTAAGCSDEGYSSSSASTSTHSGQTESEPEMLSSAPLLSPSSSSPIYDFSPQKSISTSNPITSPFTFEHSNPMGPHQKHCRLSAGVDLPKVSNTIQLPRSTDVYPFSNTYPDRSMTTTSTASGTRYFRPTPTQNSSAFYPPNTTYLAPPDWSSNDHSLVAHDHVYLTYGLTALETKQNSSVAASYFEPIGQSSNRDLAMRTNHLPLNERPTPAENHHNQVNSTSSLSLALRSHARPSSYTQDNYGNRKNGYSSGFLGYLNNNDNGNNDGHQRGDFNIPDRRFLNAEDEERSSHPLSFRSTSMSGPNQYSFQLPSPSSTSSLTSSLQGSSYTNSPSLGTPSIRCGHSPYHRHHSESQPYGGAYVNPMVRPARQNRDDYW